jgi:hypothetical protein
MATTLGSTATVALTTAFIDLSTFDEIECWLYGGKSVNRFRKIIRKSAWFTVIASQLNKCGTTGDFNTEMQAMFSRAGDYIRDVWLRAELPEVECKGGTNPDGTPFHYQARWTRNIGHNLIDEVYLQFNDLTVTKLTSPHMDFITAFLTPARKWVGYQNMIGNVPALTDPYEEYAEFESAISSTSAVKLPRYAINVPLPFWFCRDHHDAIIQAACPFNDVRLTVKFRAWQDLLIIDRIQDPVPETDPVLRANGFAYKVPATVAGISNVQFEHALTSTNLHLSGVQLWAHYAVVPNGDREKISEEADIDVLIEQVQTIPASSWAVASSPQRGIDLRFAHSIRALFFAVRRTDVRGELSNYSTHSTRGAEGAPGLIFRPVGSTDPIARAVLTYENVDRVNMPSDYYTMVAPWYSAVSIPREIGYHLLSYANKLEHLEPDGSTNFARLASVNLNIEASPTAVLQSTPFEQGGNIKANTKRWSPEYRTSTARFDILITGSSMSVLRFSSGSAGFPVL